MFTMESLLFFTNTFIVTKPSFFTQSFVFTQFFFTKPLFLFSNLFLVNSFLFTDFTGRKHKGCQDQENRSDYFYRK